MFYLSKNQFKPLAVLSSIGLVPLIVGFSYCAWNDFKMEIFIVLLFLLCLYCFIIILSYKISQTKKYYALTNNEQLEIHYPNVGIRNEDVIRVNVEQVVKLEYYRMTSIKSWFLLVNAIVPQCTFITYVEGGREFCGLIGYPSYDDVKKLADECGITMKVY